MGLPVEGREAVELGSILLVWESSRGLRVGAVLRGESDGVMMELEKGGCFSGGGTDKAWVPRTSAQSLCKDKVSSLGLFNGASTEPKTACGLGMGNPAQAALALAQLSQAPPGHGRATPSLPQPRKKRGQDHLAGASLLPGVLQSGWVPGGGGS